METRVEAVEEELRLARSRKMAPDDTSADMLWESVTGECQIPWSH